MIEKKINSKNKQQISLLVKKEAPSCVDAEASYMVEAVVAVPFFIGFLLVIVVFFQVLITQQILGNALFKTANEMAAAAYNTDMSDIETALEARIVLAKYTGLSVNLDTDMEGNYIDLQAACQIPLPIGLFGRQHITVCQRAKCRKWTGVTKEELDGVRIVYITPNGEVYHKSRECTYLRLTVQSVAGSRIQSYRNKSGGKYYGCKSCTKKKNEYSRVFITDYGTYYHSLRSCKGLKRNILAVSMYSVKNRHCCKKCGGE